MKHTSITKNSLWLYQSDFLCVEQDMSIHANFGTDSINPRHKSKITS